LPEAVLVDQPVDALAHREAAAVVLALDLVGAAHALRHFLTAAQFVHFRLPDHVQRFPGYLFQRSQGPKVSYQPGRETARLKA
jgi:non-ribosomal peptide synthetase component E (peptide arylation enzyme)